MAYPVVSYSSNDPYSSADNSFAYSQSYSLDLSDDWDEHDRSSSDTTADNLSISSSLLYEEGYLLSSLAIIGGDIPDESVEPRLDEVDSDDDNDDNDGSSSMLSNTSLKRSVTAAGPTIDRDGHQYHEESESMQFSERRRTRSVPSLLRLRGGAAVVSAPQPRRTAMSPTRKHAGSLLLKGLFTTALVTLVFEAMMGHILEFLKIRMQTATGDASYLSVLRDITAAKGIIGLWDGFCPWGVIQSVSKGAIFGMA